MENLPVYVPFLFLITVALALLLFFRASQKSMKALSIMLAWLLLQGVLGWAGFYQSVNPPRFPLLVVPPLLLTIILFVTQNGRRFLDTLDVKLLALIHIIRVPVEIVLWGLYLNKFIPQLMTFEGRNFDIFSGISAPFTYYFGYITKQWGKPVLLTWNFICLGLLFNIVIHAALSVPGPFQQLAFDQPNIAILHFPYVWLPCFLVPMVLISQLVSIRDLLKQ